MEENKQEFDPRDLNKDGKVSIGEKIGHGIDEALKDAKVVAGKAKVKAEELKSKAPEKFAEMKEDVKEAAGKAKAKAEELKSKAPEKFAEMKGEVKEAADKAKAKFDNLVSKKEGEENKDA
ncbi:MAG: hypothetical protein IKX60_07655 [Bacteroidales bacterium]|nr:hypothetical protein [Bacteroidales bacterium]